MNSFSPLLQRRSLVLALTCLLAACAKLPVMPFKPEPTRLGISLNAAATVNVDARGRSMPVVLRAYVLKNAAAFEAADFFSLFERDKQVLGEVLVWREEVALMPGETRRLDVVEVEGGRVVAVFAAFRDIDHAVWRASVPIVANQASQIVVRLQENRVELSTSISVLSLPTSVTKPSVPAFSLPPIESPAIPTVPSVPAVPSVSLPTPTIPATSVSTPSLPFSIPVR